MTKRRFGRFRPATHGGWVVLCLLALVPPASAQDLDTEFEFASGLVEIGMPDYAEKVVQQVLRLHPDQKDRAKLIQAEILISRRKFGEAEELVKEMGANNPKAQAISLALAKGYYLSGEMGKAKDLYNKFFQQYEGRVPTDPDLLRFYRDSAYQFGEMLERAGDLAGAIKAYDRVLATKPEKDIERRLLAQQAQLQVELASKAPLDERDRRLSEAKKICEKIQWGGLDIWFGQSIITLANIELIVGDRKAARKVLEDNMELLKDIDTFLKDQGVSLSVSPMAGARFLLGELLEQDAETLSRKPATEESAIRTYAKALTEFYNVFAKYGDSDWGPQAGVRAQAIKTLLEDKYGKKIDVNLGAYRSKAAEAQFRLADNLYRQKKYAEAADEYLKNLNQFPESEASPAALGNLALCYAELRDELMMKVVSGYLAERFAGKKGGAVALLALGKLYFDKDDVDSYMRAYNLYLDHFPEHGRAGAILYTLAGLRKKAGDQEGAARFYERIVKNYPKDKYYTKALSQMAWGYYLATNFAGAVEGFKVFLKEAQPSPQKVQAQFALADCYRQTGNLQSALEEYERLIQWIAPRENPFATSAADAAKNRDLLEKAVFQRGSCYARLKEPADAVRENREKAIKTYDQFVELFPDSKLAPAALNAKGTVQLEIGQFDAAAKTFDELAAKYPNSEEGKSALFALVRSAMEIKQYDQARGAFQKMLSGGGKYTPDEFGRIGQTMLDAGLLKEAIQAFQRVVASTDERILLERALFGLGSAYSGEGNYGEAIKYLEELMTKYPKSGLFYDAKFQLGAAYRETGALSNAVLALSDVFRYADSPVLINKASFDLATIQQEQGDLAGALASFLRVALLANPDDPELRPLVEKSLYESVVLGMEAGRYKDVQDSCDQYLKLFPGGERVEAVRQFKADAKLKAAQVAPAPAAEPPAGGPGP